MQPAVPAVTELVLLRTSLPDIPLRAGTLLHARVLERHGGQGIIDLAGAILTAELPEHVEAGSRLRLRVRDATAERLHLRLEPAPVAVPPPAGLPLPGGAVARLTVEERGAGRGADGAPAPFVTLVYESETLGRVELRLGLDSGALAAAVRVREGDVHARAAAAAGELRAALRAATGLPCELAVLPRHDPLDTYA
jgi:hypothetical protein